MTKISVTPSPPNLGRVVSSEFDLNEFEAAIWNKGYDVIIESSHRCPCHVSVSPLIDCQNCQGTGYFYVNPTKTKGLITNLNQENKFKSWSTELVGTIQLSINDVNNINLNFYDRITLEKEYSYFSENLNIRHLDAFTFVFTTYHPIDVVSIYLFKSSSEKLIKMNPGDYTIDPENPFCIKFNVDMTDFVTASVYYKHQLQFHLIDKPHLVRSSWSTNKDTGAQEKIRLPLQGIARLSHLIMGNKVNFDGTGFIDNS